MSYTRSWKHLKLFIVLSTIDAALTYNGLTTIGSFTEMNPLMKAFILEFSFFGIIISKLVGLSFVIIMELTDLNVVYKKIFYLIINTGLILVILNNIYLILFLK